MGYSVFYSTVDLFLMYSVVKRLGGYENVSQQNETHTHTHTHTAN